MSVEKWPSLQFDVPAMSVPVYTRDKHTGARVKKTDAAGCVLTASRIIAKERPRFSSKSHSVYSPENTASFEKWVRKHFFKAFPGSCGVYYKGKPWPVHTTFLGCRKYGQVSECDKYRKGRDFLDCRVCTHRRKNLSLCLYVFIKGERHLDLDNVIKIVLDSLNKVCFYDDSQFVVKHVEMVPYASEERLSIQIRVLPETFHSGRSLVGAYSINKLSEKDALSYISSLSQWGKDCVPDGFYDYLLRCDNRKFIKEFVDAKKKHSS